MVKPWFKMVNIRPEALKIELLKMVPKKSDIIRKKTIQKYLENKEKKTFISFRHTFFAWCFFISINPDLIVLQRLYSGP